MRVKVQFEPFVSVISVGFWAGLGKEKLENIRLTQASLPIFGYWEASAEMSNSASPPKFFLDERSFAQPAGTEEGNRRVWEKGVAIFFETDKALEDVDFKSVLNGHDGQFIVLLVFVDHKRRVFKYYIAYPIMSTTGANISCEDIQPEIHNEQCVLDPCSRPFTKEQIILGWPTRRHIYSHVNNATLSMPLTIKNTRLTLNLSRTESPVLIPGWETNSANQFVMRSVDLSPLLDPSTMAKSASDLNLKLIKWQIAPNLDLDKIQSSRCLLLGAGTLGCNVLRLLLGWGIRNISLVDSGSCSFSNPVRQTLITFQDAVQKRSKVDAVIANAMLVDPSLDLKGYMWNIPMPGHRYPDTAELLSQIENIHQLIKEHDVLFLMTDSRESRWLPTVLGCLEDKLVITIAIGFENYVALKHGPSCYFCQDSVAPVDSITNRTMDMQCTVSRPGVSMIAAGVGVELLINNLDPESLKHNPSKQQMRGSVTQLDGLFGPHSVYCTACSEKIQSECRADLNGFMAKVYSDSTVLDAFTNVGELAGEIMSDLYISDCDE